MYIMNWYERHVFFLLINLDVHIGEMTVCYIVTGLALYVLY